MKKRILVVVLALVLCFGLVACGGKKQKRSYLDNEKDALILQESTMDGVFSPFFYSSAYDGDVVGLINVGLLSMDAKGAVVAGPEYPTVAESYEIYYQDANGNKKETFAAGDEVVYEMVIKQGMKFSDGQPVTADDVLFNYYVYLDPAYTGSSTLYTLPIKGLAEYRTQVKADLYAKYSAKAEVIAKDLIGIEDAENECFYAIEDIAYAANDKYTEAEFNTFKAVFAKAGEDMAQGIIDYVNAKYGASYFEAGYGPAGVSYAKATAGQKAGYGFALWGFAGSALVATAADAGYAINAGYKYNLVEDAEGKYVIVAKTNESGAAIEGQYKVAKYDAEKNAGAKRYALADECADANTFYDALLQAHDVSATGKLGGKEYAEVIFAAYGYDYANAIDTETANLGYDDTLADVFNGFIKEAAAKDEANDGKGVADISGLVKGTNAAGKETVKVILTKQNPKAILSLGVTVAPKHYYTAGYQATAGAKVNFGVELNSDKFMAHLKKLNGAPVGAGTYKMIAEGDFVRDGDVYFERNEYFETMGNDNVYNAKIKYVVMKIISSGAEYSAIEAGDVHYATVSATADVVADVAKAEKLTSILVDNLGYGYICINPTQIKNLYERIALTTVFDLTQVYEYYPNGLADVIYRSQSQVSWAYPEGAKAMYPYDETLAAAKEWFKKAGFVEGADGKFAKADGSAVKYELYLPSDAKDHPAGGIFLKAKELLAKIGIEVELKTDENLIADIKDGSIPVYALAWQSSADPDMYQVYHFQSSAESVISNGITWLEKNGNDAAIGEIEVTKLDGSKVKMNQKQALDYLAELIEQGTEYMLAEERKPIYNKALEVLAQLSIEVPTYQRKNLFVYESYNIDAASLSSVVTPYWGPMAEIWKVSFVQGK